MKKLLFFILVLNTPFLKGQDNYMSLSFGMGIPHGDLAAGSDIFSDGYAFSGFLGDYSWVYIPRKHLGMQVSLQFISNLTDQETMENELIEITPSEVPIDAPFVYDIGKWDIVSLAAGPMATFQKGIMNLDFYLETGLYVVYPPPMRVSAIVPDNYSYTSSLSVTYLRPGLNAGLNIRLQLNEYTGIRLFSEYKYTSSKGEIIQEYESTTSGKWNYNYSANISLFNIGIGLIYHL